MIFNSFEFLIFLPCVWLLYLRATTGKRGQNAILLVSSYVFYGWWAWRFLSLIAISTAVDFSCGLAITKWPDCKRFFLVISIVANLGILGFFKYFNFFVESAARVLSILGIRVANHSHRTPRGHQLLHVSNT